MKVQKVKTINSMYKTIEELFNSIKTTTVCVDSTVFQANDPKQTASVEVQRLPNESRNDFFSEQIAIPYLLDFKRVIERYRSRPKLV